MFLYSKLFLIGIIVSISESNYNIFLNGELLYTGTKDYCEFYLHSQGLVLG